MIYLVKCYDFGIEFYKCVIPIIIDFCYFGIIDTLRSDLEKKDCSIVLNNLNTVQQMSKSRGSVVIRFGDKEFIIFNEKDKSLTEVERNMILRKIFDEITKNEINKHRDRIRRQNSRGEEVETMVSKIKLVCSFY